MANSQINVLKKIIKCNTAYFHFYRNGNAFYRITVDGIEFMFPIDLVDVGSGTLDAEMKAIVLMRWIRKAIDARSFVKTSKQLHRELKDKELIKEIVYDTP